MLLLLSLLLLLLYGICIVVFISAIPCSKRTFSPRASRSKNIKVAVIVFVRSSSCCCCCNNDKMTKLTNFRKRKRSQNHDDYDDNNRAAKMARFERGNAMLPPPSPITTTMANSPSSTSTTTTSAYYTYVVTSEEQSSPSVFSETRGAFPRHCCLTEGLTTVYGSPPKGLAKLKIPDSDARKYNTCRVSGIESRKAYYKFRYQV